jgi:hypothetical protein
VARAQRQQYLLSVIMLDIDHPEHKKGASQNRGKPHKNSMFNSAG